MITIAGHEYEVVEAGFLTLSVAERICRRYSNGESLRAIVESDDEIVSESAVRVALHRNDWFRAMWDEAGLMRADKFAEEIIEIADDRSQDMYLVVKGDDSYMAPNMAAVARAKLRVQARQMALSKLNPKRYAEKYLALEEGVGGLMVTWAGGGHAIGRVPRSAVTAARQGRVVPAVIEGDFVEVSKHGERVNEVGQKTKD